MIAQHRSVWLSAAAVLIIAAPLVVPGLGGDFKGSDDIGTDAITESHPGYQPWFQPLWKPPSDEIESMLFALQASLGTGVIGYLIGRRHGSRRDDVTRR
ncbi:energy-coupling factor ABC transporter substrate-binding protein [Telmatospirillum siberiense]|uniref:Cobalt transport protein CbiN n=2 Tax=Telmatospirillum siberiense TaxID=382514 RepID=A0A2N3PX85_9PROT|nr:energy-coupling factor ABC transporter substrate-binding protein [Telmatospirillum siberiense]PKU25020.1 energy-coupling factor ABC transporter substrate-binding protein [Telmatospirillum siberiense]